MAKSVHVFHKTLMAMGTRLDAVLPFTEEARGMDIFKKIEAELKRIESKLSIFNPDSDINNINKNAYLTPVSVDNELFKILTECVKFSQQTKGYFDITLRPLLSRMMQKENNPHETELNELKLHLGTHNIILDDARRTIRFNNKYLSLDFGGYGKGYALDRVWEILSDEHIDSAFLSFGNSSIAAIGHHPHGDYWGVGIKNPFTHFNLYTFKAKDASVSTSGITDANLKKHQGMPHIINPKTFEHAPLKKTIAVSAKRGTIAEAASTALMVCDEKDIKSILQKLNIEECIKITYDFENKALVNKIN